MRSWSITAIGIGHMILVLGLDCSWAGSCRGGVAAGSGPGSLLLALGCWWVAWMCVDSSESSAWSKFGGFSCDPSCWQSPHLHVLVHLRQPQVQTSLLLSQ